MSKTGVEVTGQNGILKGLERLAGRDLFSGWAKRRLVPLYADFQKARFITENTVGGGQQWAPITEPYKSRKIRKYGGGAKFRMEAGQGWVQVGNYPSFPGGGRKTNIATSRLLAGILPPQFRGEFHQPAGEEFRMMIMPRRAIFATTVPYAKDVDQMRNFSNFPASFKKKLLQDYMKYLALTVRAKGEKQ